MPSLQDMRERAKEAGLMKLDKLIAAAPIIGLILSGVNPAATGIRMRL